MRGGRDGARARHEDYAGVVTDESKAALPGATVTVKDVETGQSAVLTTDAQGRYRADALVPGKYDVTVELSGFRTAQYQDVSLTVGQDADRRPDANRRHGGAGRRHGRRRAGRDPAVVGDGARRQSQIRDCRSTAATSAS